MQPGEIYLAMFPFGDVAVMKLRPILLITGTIGPIPEVLVAYISSSLPAPLLPSDIQLDPAKTDFMQRGLKVVSVLRLHKLATIHTSNLVRKLGKLPDQCWKDCSSRLRMHLKLSS